VPVRLDRTPGRIAGPRAVGLLAARDISVAAQSSNSAIPSGGDADDPPPLAGVRILEITNLIAGPTAGRILADLGADVIKLEPPGGDMSRPNARSFFYAGTFHT